VVKINLKCLIHTKKSSFNIFSTTTTMTLVLKDDENLEKSLKINTIHGHGILYITNTSVILVIDKKGILFERLHTQITSITSSKNKIKLAWAENGDMFDFTFRIDNADIIVNDILRNHSYDDVFSNIQITN